MSCTSGTNKSGKSTRATMGDMAAKLAHEGFRVFPLKEGEKVPALMDWPNEATFDEKKVARMWGTGNREKCNIGIHCDSYGVAGYLLGLDIDNKNGKNGTKSLEDFEARHGKLPDTMTVQTPTGGFHKYFIVDEPVGNSAGKIADGIDIRGKGGYLVAPGSRTALGTYALATSETTKIADAPQWLANLASGSLKRGSETAKKIPGLVPDTDQNIQKAIDYLKSAEPAVEGDGGDAQTFNVSCRVKDLGISKDLCLELMADHWNTRCCPPWDTDELAGKIRNAYSYGKKPVGSETPQADFASLKFSGTDVLAGFRRDRQGNIHAERNNLAKALSRPGLCGHDLRYDEFLGVIMTSQDGGNKWRRFTDEDYTSICMKLERSGFRSIPSQLIREMVAHQASVKKFDSAMAWLESLEWDGTKRVELSLTDHFGADDTPYARAASLYFWTALAGRIMKPGIKADMVPILVGPQGARKSSAVAALVPEAEFFTDADFSLKDADLSRLICGKLVIELGELRGMHTRAVEHVKAVITRTHENWVPKFKEMSRNYPRRCIFVGTTNQDEFLEDSTGSRRWLPVRTEMCYPDKLGIDRDQLWAEAREIYLSVGILWEEAERLGRAEHGNYEVQDPWLERVEEWLKRTVDGIKPMDAPFTTADALRWGVSKESASTGRGDQLRMANVLRTLGKRLGFGKGRAVITEEDGPIRRNAWIPFSQGDDEG